MSEIRMLKVGTYRRLGLAPEQHLERETPAQDAIVLCHLGIPDLDARAWSLTIDGLLSRPMRLTLDELRRRPRKSLTSVHQCAGNPLQPDTPARRICNVTWTGVPLASILSDCGVDARATHVWSYGADHGSFEGVAVPAYIKDLPLDRVGEDVLVAYELNGQPLPPEHGFPVRLVVPGFYGTNSVKWLTRLSLTDGRAAGPFTTRWYNDAVRDESGAATGQTEPVWRIAPESIIVSPAANASLRIGERSEIWGWAWADGGVVEVSVSTDGGQSWTPVVLEPPQGRAWQKFSLAWTPQAAGPQLVQSRARSTDGAVQPASGRRNAVHSVPVVVNAL